jgi:hypothetical protein
MQERLERITIFTPLGIRFWDLTREIPVTDDLQVTARPDMADGPTIPAFRTASGIYAFQGLPGLHAVEYPVGDVALTTSPPDTKRFVVEVKDLQRRFLSVVFSVSLPLPYKGIFPVATPGSPPGPPGFYLFSAPTRLAAAGMAAVRGHLVEHSTQRPAAYAVLEVQFQDKNTWYGIADERGCLAVLFPYPAITGALGASPPSAPQIPLHEQQWELTFRVRYAPATLTIPLGTETPDLFSILNQSPGFIWPSQVGPPVAEWFLDLIFGQELVTRTDDLSTLLISPAGSPS